MSDNDELLQIINSHMIFEVHPSLILAVSHCDGIDDLTMGQLLGVVSTVNKDVHEQALGIANDICRTLREFKYDGAPIRDEDLVRMPQPPVETMIDSVRRDQAHTIAQLQKMVDYRDARIKMLEGLLDEHGIPYK
jgi:hypothetical protein